MFRYYNTIHNKMLRIHFQCQFLHLFIGLVTMIQPILSSWYFFDESGTMQQGLIHMKPHNGAQESNKKEKKKNRTPHLNNFPIQYLI